MKLPTTYFGPISWYRQLLQSEAFLTCDNLAGAVSNAIDTGERYVKQTFRNHCLIATANGIQKLTVPVAVDHHPALTSEVRLSDHGKWRSEHWNALCSAYGESPFFDYYADDFRPFFERHDWEMLVDFNQAIVMKVVELIEPTPNPSRRDGRLNTLVNNNTLVTNNTLVNNDSNVEANQTTLPLGGVGGGLIIPYWQVYQQRHGFLPDLSILDLLFCMGPEAPLYL